MNQYEHKHYYYQRQDPFKLGYWEDDNITPKKGEVILGTILLIVAFVTIGSVLFLN